MNPPPSTSDSASPQSPPGALGLLEVFGFTPSMVALDAMEKAGNVQLVQLELNDMLGVVIKVVGDVAAVHEAVDQGYVLAESMQGRPVKHVIHRPDPGTWKVVDGPVEFNPLIQQNVVKRPQVNPQNAGKTMNQTPEVPSALGFIETQGFTAVFEAIDTACKAANVEVVGKEKLGGGYITVVVKGDVAAVKAAIEAGRTKAEGLGKIIAAHVIPRPSASVLSLLPK